MNVNKKIDQWVRDAFKNENFKDIKVKLTGSSGKGDGYIGDITFVKVNIVTSDGERKDLELVIKYGKLNDSLRESMPVRQAYEREIYVYEKVIPQLQKFLDEKKINLFSQFLPKCYGTLLYDNEEVIILENYKAQNYDLHDRYQPLDINHLKLTLEMYGKWHALSFAYQDQNPKKAKELFGNLDDLVDAFFKVLDNYLTDVQESLYMILRQKNEVGLIERMKKQIPDFNKSFVELLDTKNEKCVFVHGDCWNNNFLFKYGSNKSNKPEAVKFLDYQLSNLKPPVFDLAYHIYSVASEKELEHFDELLKIYHASLSKTLKELGSDVDSIFSYEDLIQQWKQFSSFGIMMATMNLPMTLATKDDTLNLQDLMEESQLIKNVKKTLLTNGDILTSRTIAYTKHYLDFLDKYTEKSPPTKLVSWIREIFKDENFKEIKVKLTGSSEKGAGYIGDITFVKVNVVTSHGETKDLDLVIKYGKLNETLRESMPIRKAYEREIYVYEKVVPQLQQFLDKKKINLFSQFLPKCYGTLLYDNEEVIVLENLKAQNYDLNDRYQPLDINHLKLTLETYGKWHALSFAYQDQNPQKAKELFENLDDLVAIFSKSLGDNYVNDVQEVLCIILRQKNEVGLIERIKQRIPDFNKTFFELLEKKHKKRVFVHGDCWNNNFMFKYGSGKSNKPEAVKFLDFQISNFKPPVFDLAYHIYSVASEKELEHFDDLLKIYHTSLSKTLKDLGSDVDSIFSYEDLVQQWKQLSSFGVIMTTMNLPMTLALKDNTMDIQDIKEESQVIKTAKKTLLTNGDILTSRTIAYTKHYLDFLDKNPQTKLLSWIREVFKHENYKDIKVKSTGSSEKGDGYGGDIVFAKVNVVTSDGETKDLDLVIKSSKSNEALRESMPIRQAFEREIYTYGKVIQQFQQFLDEKKINSFSEFLPKYYGSLLYDKEEVIVLENLKAGNYDLHDRYQPMDINHLKLTLETYGKWHALSFAYQDQNPEKAKKLFENLEDLMGIIFKSNNFLSNVQDVLYTILSEKNEVGLIDQIPDFNKMFQKLSETKSQQNVFLHGDCWNNNFMFKYGNVFGKSNKPQAVKIIDFQISNFKPPVYDLAYHIYSVASEKELQNFDELLKIYHSSLSKTLKELGSDVHSIYPYEDLVQQWKQFSGYGIIMTTLVLPMTLASKDDTMDIQDIKEDSQLVKTAKKTLLTNGDILTSRTIAYMKHYLNFLDNPPTKLVSWIRDIFKHENFKEIKVKLTGSSEKGDGYIGDITFVKVNTVTSDGETKDLELVIKYGKSNNTLRELMPIRKAYEREIYVYGKVIPQLQQFLDKKKINLFSQFLPKCYGTLLYDNEEVIVLENLKAQNYDLHDRYQPLDINHLKLTLETYGKWHALSFAYQDQNPQKAKELFENLDDLVELFSKSLGDNYVDDVQEVLCTILRQKNEVGLIERIKQRIPDFNKTFFELLEKKHKKRVFVHGDCWNNNFMFKYGSGKSNKPEAVKFLDFQISNFKPPVFDLAYHIYSVASEKELEHFDDLLKIYHTSLSKTLKDLGSDVDSIFSYEDLVQQWKQLSSFGVIMTTMNLPMTLALKDNTMDIQDIKEESQVIKTAKKTLLTNGDILTSRTIAYTKHYLDFLDKNPQTKLLSWIREVFKHENYKDIKVKSTGSSEKGDRYGGDIVFAKVNVVTSDGETKDLDLVIKSSKSNEALRESMPIRQAFEREIYTYGKVIQQFQQFLDEKKINSFSEFLPKYYGSLLYDKEEVIVLENLKAGNYDLHDRYQPMDINHLKLTLETYGKWHALSFAYQDQNPEKAKKLFENLEDLMGIIFKSNNFLSNVQDVLYTILSEKNEVGLIDQIPDFNKMFQKLSETKSQQNVFLHGDCWNNNFMFKYGNVFGKSNKPQAVKIIDFQISNFKPPVYDLAYHIYSVASEKELQNFDELLKIYHSSLSKTLKELGSDVHSIYPYEDLVQQWKQFSGYGIIMTTLVLPMTLASKDDTMDIQDIKEDSQLVKTAKKTLLTNGDILTSRTIAYMKHYLNFLDNPPTKLVSWIRDIFKHENFKEIKVKLTGSSEKGDGYIGDITFVKVNTVTSDGETKDLELVIKYGKSNNTLRELMPIRKAYEREIYVYGKVIPQLQQFLDKKKINLFSQFLPKCYGTLLYDNEEVIVLENLKAQNYDLHDRYQPLDINHLKLTLETYGKWHALSFAYQDQNPQKAKELFENLDDLVELFSKSLGDNYVDDVQEVLCTILRQKNEVGLIERIKQRIPDFNKTFFELLEKKHKKRVFVHGDCWNNNFMFKYGSDKSNKPEAVKFLDFQISNFKPPVFDIAYHIYSVSSEKELQHFDDLLKIYHASLSKTLKELGSDADSIFSYEDLVQQWKQLSSFGVIMTTMNLPMTLALKDNTMDIQDIKEESQVIKTAKKTLLTNGDILTSRTIAYTKHYLDFLDKNPQTKLLSWIREVFKHENYKDITVKSTGSSEKGDGYGGDIVFAKVNVVTSDGETKDLDLVIKSSKSNEALRESMPIRQAFEREIYTYGKVIPQLQQFLDEKKINSFSQFLPKCYGSLLYDKEEVIVLENLKAENYDLHDRYQPMDINHLKLTLEMYGKWHALSFAYLDQNPEKAKKLFENLEDLMGIIFKSNNFLSNVQDVLHTILSEKNEVGLIDQIPDFNKMFQKLSETKSQQNVFLHGDCWNNNFMFKYGNVFGKSNKPQAVKIIDFQISNFKPPVYDLAYHIYSVASEKELQNFDKLLKIYHSSLSKTLKQLGSNVDSIYPYDDLVQQWKQFSGYGIIMTTLVLPMTLSSKDDTMDIQDIKEDSQLVKTAKKTLLTNGDILTSRTIAYMKHYLDFLDNPPTKLVSWIRDIFKHENFKEIKVKLTGSSEKGDGYIGDITFVKVNIVTSDAETKDLELVIKYGKSNNTLRELMPIRKAYEREIYVYGKVIPQLQQFLDKKKINLFSQFLPKCYGTLLYDNEEVIVLENLKAQNYDLHDRYQPLDINHLKLTLETYGKWHALSFAYQDQNPQMAKELFENLDDLVELFSKSLGDNYVDDVQEVLWTILRQKNEVGIIERIKQRIPDFNKTFFELLETKHKKRVFVHGDCWNNNFMFKYGSDKSNKPEAVKFLDFQISNFKPPVFDIAYHIYSVSSEKELQHFDDLLKIYHTSLSKTLKDLGSDVDSIFSYEDLVQQWKQLSSFGVIMTTMNLPMTLALKDNTMDIQDIKEESQVIKTAKKTLLTNGDILTSRTIAYTKHYLEFLDKYTEKRQPSKLLSWCCFK